MATNGKITQVQVNGEVYSLSIADKSDHYVPTPDSSEQLSADASSSTNATWGSTALVTGVNLQRDATGHVTGVTVDSIRMPANPNTNYYHTPSYTSTAPSSPTGGSSNLKIGTGTGVNHLYVPVATADAAGVTIVYPAASCTTFTSDNGACTPAAVKKAVGMFEPKEHTHPVYHVGTSQPTNTNLLWIDTSSNGGLKYHNGSSWVTVPVAFS